MAPVPNEGLKSLSTEHHQDKRGPGKEQYLDEKRLLRKELSKDFFCLICWMPGKWEECGGRERGGVQGMCLGAR